MHLIPDSWSHLHILASVFPSVGLVFALGFYVVAMITNNTGLMRICLAVFALLGLVAIPTYFSGTGSWDVLSGNSKISDDLMDYHYGWGVTALAVLMATGAVAFIELLRSSRFGKFSNNALHLVLGLAIVSLGLMAVVGEMGWELNHHELPLATEKTRKSGRTSTSSSITFPAWDSCLRSASTLSV